LRALSVEREEIGDPGKRYEPERASQVVRASGRFTSSHADVRERDG
jgi:hypothetical protein